MNIALPLSAESYSGLTPQERSELESAIDGPITAQDVADKIAQRGIAKPEMSAKDRKVLTEKCQRNLVKYRNDYAAAVALTDRYRNSGNDRKADMWANEAESLRKEVEFYEEAVFPMRLQLAAE